MSDKNPLLHILVIGFHHKKGCQVEFSYPPIVAGTDGCGNECPSGWKYLPTLALPDGSHNFEEDSVFFNLPSLDDPNETIYGVSCYRQIPVEKLKIRTADVTRSTVQKSVCALILLPIYGYIEVKLSLIAHAFFEQGDFSSTKILIDAYDQLNACLLNNNEIIVNLIPPAHHETVENDMLPDCDTTNINVPPEDVPIMNKHIFIGLNLRDLILKWRHKLLILYKLFLLQKRVICFGSPVRPMCTLILGIASLHPLLLECGFHEVACVRTSRPMSPMPDFSSVTAASLPIVTKFPVTTVNAEVQVQKEHEIHNSRTTEQTNNICSTLADHNNTVLEDLVKDKKIIKCDSQDNTSIESSSNDSESTGSGSNSSDSKKTRISIFQKQNSNNSTSSLDIGKRTEKSSLPRDASVDALASASLEPLCALKPNSWNAPIPIFQYGNLCLPYLSLPYMDLLTDSSVLGYVIGTSNILFQQKKQLADVLVDVDGATMETQDPELRKLLQLTTEDLRFIDFIIRHVVNPKENAEGSEIWIREQFQGYMVAMLKTSLMNDSSKEIEHFNGGFVAALKKTQCYQEWYEKRPDESVFENIPNGHPFAGTLSVADMKLRIAQTMHNTESGRKINQAVNNTSKAVGGALSQAKGAFSNWWSSITTSPPPPINSTQNSHASDDESSSIKGTKDHSDDDTQSCGGDVKKSSFEKENNSLANNEKQIKNEQNNKIEIGQEAEIFDSNRQVFAV